MAVNKSKWSQLFVVSKKKKPPDRSSQQDCQHFSTIMCTNKVYTVPCTHSYVKRWEFCTPCFKKKNFFANLYTIVPYGVHNGSPGLILFKNNFKCCKKSRLNLVKLYREISNFALDISTKTHDTLFFGSI